MQFKNLFSTHKTQPKNLPSPKNPNPQIVSVLRELKAEVESNGDDMAQVANALLQYYKESRSNQAPQPDAKVSSPETRHSAEPLPVPPHNQELTISQITSGIESLVSGIKNVRNLEDTLAERLLDNQEPEDADEGSFDDLASTLERFGIDPSTLIKTKAEPAPVQTNRPVEVRGYQ